MKKILYYIPNIILYLYIFLYNSLQEYFIVIGREQMQMFAHSYAQNIMNNVTLCIVVVIIGLKFVFSSKRIKVSKIEKIINICLLIIGFVILFLNQPTNVSL